MIKRKILIGFLLIACLFDSLKTIKIMYLPFELPGKLMAMTVPPFGIFIESKFEAEGDGCGSILSHEKVHWEQYRRMGLFGYYFEYFKLLLKEGRIYNWMEEEAKEKSKC